jgi:hypothetical protein
MIEFLHSNLGMVSILCIVVYLVLYTNPVLGILSIFVVYELIRRSRSSYATPTSGYFTSPNPMIITTYPNTYKDEHEDDEHKDDEHKDTDFSAELEINNSNPKSVHFAENDNIFGIAGGGGPTTMNSKLSTENTIQNIMVLEYTPDEKSRNLEMERMNREPDDALEIDVVNSMAPMGQLPSSSEYIETGFKPVADNTHNAMHL